MILCAEPGGRSSCARFFAYLLNQLVTDRHAPNVKADEEVSVLEFFRDVIFPAEVQHIAWRVGGRCDIYMVASKPIKVSCAERQDFDF